MTDMNNLPSTNQNITRNIDEPLPRSRPQEAWAPIVLSLGKEKKRIRLYIYHCADNIKMVAASEACLVYTF